MTVQTRPPYGAYAGIVGTFAGGMAATAAIARLLDRDPREHDMLDLAVLAAGLAASQILAPRFGRILTWSLAAAGANDWLQAGFAGLAHKANQLEQRTE